MALGNMQQAQYGDRVALDKLGASRMTNNPAAAVQTMKIMEGGRPAETDPVKLAMRSAARPGTQAVAPEEQRYQEQFNDLAVQYATALKWQRIASQPGAGPFTKSYALAAMYAFAQNLRAVRGETPFFDGI